MMPATGSDSSRSEIAITVSTRLKRSELKAFEALAKRRKVTPAKLLRDLVFLALSEPRAATFVDPVLSEIVGVRLLLVNLLKPREEAEGPLGSHDFMSILDEVRKLKRQVASDIQREYSEGTGR